MKKIKFKIKKEWKSILSAVLVGVLLFGAVSAAVGILNKDTKTISSTAFDVGGINDQGNHVDSKTSIYTKDMFECQGLSIEPDFEASGTYKVFYYDSNKNFIGATDALKASDGVYNKADTYILAKYCRIVITPEVPMDDDGNVEEDFKIRFYEVAGYAGDYTITVNKKQKKIVNGENEFIYHGLALFDHDNAAFAEGTPGAVASEFIDVTGVDCVQLYVSKVQFASTTFRFYGYDMDTTPIMTMLDLSKYDVIDCGDYVFVEIDNLDSFETILLADFDYTNTDTVGEFQNIKLFVER